MARPNELRINRAKSWLYMVVNPLIAELEEQSNLDVHHEHLFSKEVKHLVSDEGFMLTLRDVVRDRPDIEKAVEAYNKASTSERVTETKNLLNALEKLGIEIMDEFDLPAAPFRGMEG